MSRNFIFLDGLVHQGMCEEFETKELSQKYSKAPPWVFEELPD